jgi:hypothetical protein
VGRGWFPPIHIENVWRGSNPLLAATSHQKRPKRKRTRTLRLQSPSLSRGVGSPALSLPNCSSFVVLKGGYPATHAEGTGKSRVRLCQPIPVPVHTCAIYPRGFVYPCRSLLIIQKNVVPCMLASAPWESALLAVIPVCASSTTPLGCWRSVLAACDRMNS